MLVISSELYAIMHNTRCCQTKATPLWAIQALLVAKWPVELQYHPKSCIRQTSQLLPKALPFAPGRAPDTSHTEAHTKGVLPAHRFRLRQLVCMSGPSHSFFALT